MAIYASVCVRGWKRPFTFKHFLPLAAAARRARWNTGQHERHAVQDAMSSSLPTAAGRLSSVCRAVASRHPSATTSVCGLPRRNGPSRSRSQECAIMRPAHMNNSLWQHHDPARSSDFHLRRRSSLFPVSHLLTSSSPSAPPSSSSFSSSFCSSSYQPSVFQPQAPSHRCRSDLQK